MFRRTFLRQVISASAGGLLLKAPVWAQAGLQVTPLRGKLHLLAGAGGNIVIQDEPEGLLMIDSGLTEQTAGILAETGKIGNGHVTRLFNTHWHTDHTGSNVALGKQGVKIMAQTNVKTRLAKGQFMEFFKREVPPMTPEGLPTETFAQKGKLKFGDDTAHYEHLPPAHTDGDSVIHFHEANVFHGGDLLFNGMYPFIDYGSAGSLRGMAANAEQILKMTDEKTIIVPGHGAVMQKKDVKAFADMLADCLEIMNAQLRDGRTLEQMQADKPFKKFDEAWGQAFIKPEAWIAMNYAGMKKA